MHTKAAIAYKTVQLCNEPANISGVSPSTVYGLLNEKSQNPGAVTSKRLTKSLPPGGRWHAQRDGRSPRDFIFVLTLL